MAKEHPLTAHAVSNGAVAELSWPLAYKGWLLQTQTNAPSIGWSTNWQDVAGSTTTNQVSLALPSVNSSAFYRLKLP